MVATSKPHVFRKIVKKTRVRISKSGQITLPAGTRKRLGVEAGDQVDVNEYADGEVTVLPVRILKANDIAGKFGPAIEPDALKAALRDARQSGMVRKRYRDGSVFDDID